MTSELYQHSDLNSELYEKREKLADYFRSVSHFFTPDYMRDGYSFLDIGGATGGLACAINDEVARIDATIIDPDPKSIEIGRQRFPEWTFLEGFFPEVLGEKVYDVVSMQALYPQLPDWKGTLLSMSRHARKFVNFSCLLRLDGTTVVDSDVSYFYYLDTGERVHQVINNIYEITNFMCIPEMNVKKIDFYGYHTPASGHNFRCVPNRDQIKGNFMLELFAEGENPKRFGGQSNMQGGGEYRFFIPEMNYVIDGEAFDVRD